MTVASKLSEARKLIERGWCRNRLERYGHVCAMGALYAAFNGAPRDTDQGDDVIAAMSLLRTSMNCLSIGTWNDRQKSKKPVIEAFKRAEQLARDSAE